MSQICIIGFFKLSNFVSKDFLKTTTQIIFNIFKLKLSSGFFNDLEFEIFYFALKVCFIFRNVFSGSFDFNVITFEIDFCIGKVLCDVFKQFKV